MSTNYILTPDGELYHYGVKGQKWGVRRYQNKDGSLTPAGKKRLAKDLKKDYKRNFQPSQPAKLSETYKTRLKSEIDKVVTDEDKKRIGLAKRKWIEKEQEADPARKKFDELARKYAKKAYDEELRMEPHAYETAKDKQRLMDYLTVEYGNDMAFRDRPDLFEATTMPDKYYSDYMNECRKVGDKLLGEYGGMKLRDTKYYTLTVRDTVGDMVSSMEHKGWKA